MIHLNILIKNTSNLWLKRLILISKIYPNQKWYTLPKNHLWKNNPLTNKTALLILLHKKCNRKMKMFSCVMQNIIDPNLQTDLEFQLQVPLSLGTEKLGS